ERPDRKRRGGNRAGRGGGNGVAPLLACATAGLRLVAGLPPPPGPSPAAPHGAAPRHFLFHRPLRTVLARCRPRPPAGTCQALAGRLFPVVPGAPPRRRGAAPAPRRPPRP